jgi:Spy/CpxP family protein refolding chaperone
MKTSLLTIACAIACSIPLTAAAQQAVPAAGTTAGAADPATLATLRERIRNDRKGLVAQNLSLTEAESKAFWPVYDRCHESIDGAQRRANRVVVDYVTAEGQMTDAHAKQIIRDALEAEADATRARKSCFDRVAKVLPGKKAARYFQIENKIAALARYDVAVTLPLVQ